MRHITYEQRYTISCLLKEGYNQPEIGKSQSVISREILRNRDQRNGKYRHALAHKKYCARKSAIPKHTRFTDDIKENVKSLLNEDYSPDQIVGTLKKQEKTCVSHERIFNTSRRIKNKMEACTLTFEEKGEAVENAVTARNQEVL
jgi:IS30 family transposase